MCGFLEAVINQSLANFIIPVPVWHGNGNIKISGFSSRGCIGKNLENNIAGCRSDYKEIVSDF